MGPVARPSGERGRMSPRPTARAAAPPPEAGERPAGELLPARPPGSARRPNAVGSSRRPTAAPPLASARRASIRRRPVLAAAEAVR